jgi:hypothetical protein
MNEAKGKFGVRIVQKFFSAEERQVFEMNSCNLNKEQNTPQPELW